MRWPAVFPTLTKTCCFPLFSILNAPTMGEPREPVLNGSSLIAQGRIARSKGVRPFRSLQTRVLSGWHPQQPLPRAKGLADLFLEVASLWGCVWMDWCGGLCFELPEVIQGQPRTGCWRRVQGVGCFKQVVTSKSRVGPLWGLTVKSPSFGAWQLWWPWATPLGPLSLSHPRTTWRSRGRGTGEVGRQGDSGPAVLAPWPQFLLCHRGVDSVTAEGCQPSVGDSAGTR